MILSIGQVITKTIKLTEKKLDTNPSVTLVINLPDGIEISSTTPSTGTFNILNKTWSLSNIEKDVVNTLEVDFTITDDTLGRYLIECVGTSSQPDSPLNNNIYVIEILGESCSSIKECVGAYELVDNEDGTYTFIYPDGSEIIIEGLVGPPGPPGADGTSINVQGTDTYANIIAVSSPSQNDLWIASDTTVNADAGDGIVYNGTTWINIGPIRGPEGPAGPAGPPGVVGSQGPTGPAGPQGNAGPEGPAGPQGAEGPAGPAGIQGVQGVQGPAGPVGPQGPEGASGPQGNVGPAGPQGNAGPEGPAGPAGAQGVQGTQGLTGAGVQGSQGTQGVQGTQGFTGSQGAQGSTGAQGVQGLQGTNTLSYMSIGQLMKSGNITVSSGAGETVLDFENYALVDENLFFGKVQPNYTNNYIDIVIAEPSHFRIFFSVKSLGTNSFGVRVSASGGSFESGSDLDLFTMENTTTEEFLSKTVVVQLNNGDRIRAYINPVGLGTHTANNPVLMVEYLAPVILI